MALLTFAKAIWRWSWLIALSAIIVALSVYAVTRRMTPVYEAQTTVAVSFRSSEAVNISATDQEMVLDTYIQFIRQRQVLNLVIEEMNLDMSYPELVEKIQVAVVGRNTLLFRVTVHDSDPERAAQIANTLVAVSTVEMRQFFGPDRIASRALLRVVDMATPPLSPIQPRPLRSAVLFGVFAAVLASGGVVIKELMDTTIRTGDQVAAVLGVAPLVAIPTHTVRARGFLPKKQQHISTVDRASPGAEAYRMLRTRVKYAHREQPIRSLTVVSANPGEGKSTTAANLAVAMAQSGQRVILVDADLRNPSLHTLFQRDNDHGLTTALSQHDGDWISDNLVNTDMQHLRLMPSGPLPHNPAELLETARMHKLHDTLLHYADIVIFDSSPLLPFVDAALLGNLTDAALAVVRANTTRAETLLQFRHRLEGFQVHLLGVVLNEARQELSGSYGSSYGSRPSDLPEEKTAQEQGASIKVIEMPRNSKATPQDVEHIINDGEDSSFPSSDSGKKHTR